MSGRKIIYPYNLTGKLALFPAFYYYKNAWPFKYYLWATVACIPIFWKIQQLTCSPGNVAKFEQLKKKEHEEHLKHLEHLL